ncbi:LptF/LptG family permease [Lyngbya sp. CCY1209]|uniref:LptF/LptG family permease n=1 Tax=Lyngbya sp. CCY1209 TaxID=2886103 RepID=UPI002D215E86|nr:LptF/LptG family permease [Lyngbya sp. CCY1209]MEB3882431.1 LptF/LptG family permease [Lyngbya sp. CCY1209]
MKLSVSKSLNSASFRLPNLSVLDRYIIQELIPPFLFGVGLFTSVAVTVGTVFELVRKVAESGLPVGIAFQVFLLKMPDFIVLAFPMSMILTTLMVYGRLSSDSELIALRSCGISIYRLVIPAVIFSFFVTGLTFAFNELIVPAANYRASYTLERALNQDEIPIREHNIFYPEYQRVRLPDSDKKVNVLVRLFYAEEFENGEMQGVTILDRSREGITQIISSESAVWNPTQTTWDFYEGTVYLVDPDGSYRNIARFDHKELHLSRAPLDLASDDREYGEMNIAQTQEYLQLMKMSGDQKKVIKTQVRIQQKYALPFVCVVFGLLGASLGSRPGRTNRATSFGVSVMIIFAYYLLSFITGAMGQKAILSPFMAAWLPTLLGLGVAGFFLYRTSE